MTLDYLTLEKMRLDHPSWRLLRADQAPLVASFLNRVFIQPNVRVMAQADLAEALEDELFTLRNLLGAKEFPKDAQAYLNDWAANDKGWLRKFYQKGSDEPYFDLMPSTEKAISWLESLTARSFVGTESRLLTVFELLKQMCEGTETDKDLRIAELKKRRDEIDREMAQLESGDISLLADTAVKERFQQFTSISRELLSDFREVEQNFRALDRSAREKIALWKGDKGSLLEEIMGERDQISDTDQGNSFRAFWDFLMSSRRQEEFTQLLSRVLSLPAVNELNPDPRVHRIHYDWLEAGEHTQLTVAKLSQQLRRFLDDAAWLQNRRIIEILRDVEMHALAVSTSPPAGEFFFVNGMSAQIELSFERPLYKKTNKPRIAGLALDGDGDSVDTDILFSHSVVDKSALANSIRRALQLKSQITLSELLEIRPLEYGLAELVTYLQLASDSFETTTDEDVLDTVQWIGDNGERKQATLPRVIFVR